MCSNHNDSTFKCVPKLWMVLVYLDLLPADLNKEHRLSFSFCKILFIFSLREKFIIPFTKYL